MSSLLAVAAALGCGSAAASAQDGSLQVDSELRARFGFLGPTRGKIGDGLDLLRVRDLDGDGRAEIVLEDTRRGRLVVLRLEENGEALNDDQTLDTGGSLRGLALGDVGGDGTSELLLLDRRGRLTVRRLPAADAAAAPAADGWRDVEVDVGVPSRNDVLRCADLDGDGGADAVVLTRDGLRVVTGLQDRPQVSPAMPLGEGESRDLLLQDLDGDRRVDVVLVTNDERRALRVARGDGRGGFGPWLMFPMERVRSICAGPGSSRGEPTLVALRGNRGRVVDHVLRREQTPSGDAAVQFVALPPAKRGSFPFAVGDFDGDGNADLAIAQPERAELTFLLERDGRFAVESHPTLAGVNGLAAGDLDGDGRHDLVLGSTEEKTLAWWSGARPRDAFPERIVAGVEPVTVAVEPGSNDVLLLVRDRRDMSLHRITRSDAGFSDPAEVLSLGRVNGSPQRILCGEFDARAGGDLAIVLPGDGLVVLSGNESGGYDRIDSEGGAAELASRIEDGAVATYRDAAGQTSLWLTRDRYARQLRLDEKGLPVVLKQVGVPAGANELSLGACLADGTLLLLDRKTNQLFRVGPSGALVPVALPKLGATHVLAHGANGDAIILGRGGVLRVGASDGWVLEELRAREPVSDDSRFYGCLTADLDGDSAADLVVADAHLHGCHVYVAEPGAIHRALAMPVYEPPDTGDEQSEPRMMATGDVDGDGRDDLVMVAFDHVLVYRQER